MVIIVNTEVYGVEYPENEMFNAIVGLNIKVKVLKICVICMNTNCLTGYEMIVKTDFRGVLMVLQTVRWSGTFPNFLWILHIDLTIVCKFDVVNPTSICKFWRFAFVLDSVCKSQIYVFCQIMLM